MQQHCYMCNPMGPQNCEHCHVLDQLQLLNTTQGQPHVDLIAVIEQRDEKDMSDHDQGFTIQVRVQLVHLKLHKGPPNHNCHLLFEPELCTRSLQVAQPHPELMMIKNQIFRSFASTVTSSYLGSVEAYCTLSRL